MADYSESDDEVGGNPLSRMTGYLGLFSVPRYLFRMKNTFSRNGLCYNVFRVNSAKNTCIACMVGYREISQKR